ncbi:MAG: Precorrin-6Y C(5,15)-methyltransferase [decarboxylating] [Hyphomicrobiaceae bacterium hypho_1]
MTPWLTIVGVNPNGASSIGEQANMAIQSAVAVAGSKRLLDILDVDNERRYIWPSPFSKGLAWLKSMSGQPIAVLASGDPMHYGVGSSLASKFSIDEYCVLPAPSSFSLAAARLGWALQDTICLSLHGRPLQNLRTVLAPKTRLLILTRDGSAPAEIMRLLCQAKYSNSLVSVLENLGGNNEAYYEMRAKDGVDHNYSALNIMAVQCLLDKDAFYFSPIPGLPDSAFKHDGQLTKREVRAVTISSLIPRPNELLWDIGAGCGSIAIEWLRCAPHNMAIAFEHNQKRACMIRQNAIQLGVPHLCVVQESAPNCLLGQPQPDAIFLGGACSEKGIFETCWKMLRSGGRFVANAITLEGQAVLSDYHENFGGEIVNITISYVKSVGRFRGLHPGMPVMQWRILKP